MKDRAPAYKKGLGMVTGLTILYLATGRDLDWLPSLIVALGFCFLLIPAAMVRLLRGPEWIISKIATAIGAVVLTAIFFLVLFPLSLLRRMTDRGDSMHLGKAPATTLFTTEHNFKTEDFRDPW